MYRSVEGTLLTLASEYAMIEKANKKRRILWQNYISGMVPWEVPRQPMP